MSSIIIVIVMLLGLLTGAFGGTVAGPNCVPGDDSCHQHMSEWEPIVLDGTEGVIVPAEYAPEVAWPYVSDAQPTGWTIQESDLVPLEAGIDDYMKTVDPHGAALPASLDDHYRQYAGIMDQGEKKILVNGFCTIEYFENWRSQWIEVDDGGTCFFRALYNADTEQFEWFSFNGFA